MKVLLDECVPRQIKKNLTEHECRTVPEVGLAGKKNGELLSFAETAGFEVFITLDRGIEYEQSLGRRTIALVLIRARSMPELLQRLHSIETGQVVHVGFA